MTRTTARLRVRGREIIMKTRGIFITSAVALATACTGGSDGENSAFGGTGLALTVDVTGKSDVGIIRYDVTPVDCETGETTGPTETIDRELEPTKIPGGITELEDNPLDKESEHIFADAFITTEPGCYDVTASPLTAEGEPSEVCASAFKEGIEVLEKETVEVFMISQCRGRDPGSLDAIVGVNHEPEITDLYFPESKFGLCESAREVCVTVEDVDYDPIEIEWELSSDSPEATGPVVTSREYDEATGMLTECVEYTPEMPGKYDVTARAYDLVWRDGELVRVEDWLADEGYPNESHAEHNFFFYASDCLECDDRLDMLLMQDLSGSFGDDLRVMNDLAPALFDAIQDGSRGAVLGVASYVDRDRYLYRTDQALTDDKDTFVSAVRGLSASGGGDFPESQLVGLLQAAQRTEEVGWREESKRTIVLTTDAAYHEAGDCPGCVANNGDAVMDPNEDYPSVEQTAAALVDADITPVFAVTVDQIPTYEALMDSLVAFGVNRGNVVELARDSDNLIDAVLSGLECRKITPDDLPSDDDFDGTGGGSTGGTGGDGSTGGTGGGGTGGDGGTGGTGGTGGDGSTGGTGGGSTDTSFDIELREVTALTPELSAAFASAVTRMERIIVDDVPDQTINLPAGACGTAHPAISEIVDDLTIFVHFESLGPERAGTLAMAGPCVARGSLLPAVGTMTFNSDLIDSVIDAGLVEDVVLHEMAHALGFGTLWPHAGLISGAGTADPYFTGAHAIASFDDVGGMSYAGNKVPVENTGGAGTADGHFRESVMDSELMTGYANLEGNPLSIVSVGAFEDFGYGVDYTAANAYSIPASGTSALRSSSSHLAYGDDIHDGPVFLAKNDGALVQL